MNKMETTAIVLSVCAILVSLVSINLAKQANSIATEANIESKKANSLNRMALNNSDKPNIRISGLTFDPDKLKVYVSSDSLLIDGREKLNSKTIALLKKAPNSGSVQNINGTDYYLIKLIEEDSNWNFIYLYLDILEIRLENFGSRATEFEIIKAYSKISGGKNIFTDQGYSVKLDPIHQERDIYILRVAYACEEGHPASIKFGNLHAFGNEKIDFSQHKDRAIDFINFWDSGYLYRCQGNSGTDYYQKVIINFNENNIIQFKYSDHDPQDDEIFTQ